jgi:DNA repair protein RadC
MLSEYSLEYLASPRAQMTRFPGVGDRTAARIRAGMELGKRSCLARPNESPTIQTPADAADVMLYEMAHLEQEHMRVMLLNTRNQLLGTVEVYKGSLNSSLIRIGELFKDALRNNAAAVVFVHNHPSGDPTPSPEDMAVTRAMVEAGKLLDVEVLDHIIIGKGHFMSLKAKGLGFD